LQSSWFKNRIDLRSWNFDWATNKSFLKEPTIQTEILIHSEFWSIPSFINQQTFIIGGWDHYLRCFDVNGMELKWALELSSPIYSSPAIINENSFILGGEDGVLRRISVTGKIEWEFKANDRIHATPTIDHNRTIVFATSYDHHVYALDVESGKQLWSRVYNEDVKDDIYSSPALTKENNIIFGTGSEVVCIDKRGNRLWAFTTNGYVDSTPALDYESNIGVVGSEDNNIYGFDITSGNVLWKYKTGDKVNTSAAISGDIVAIGSDDGFLYACNIKSGKLVWKKDNYGKKMLWTPLTVLPDRNFVYVTLDECLYCTDYTNGNEVWKKSFPRGVHSAPGVSSDGYMAIGSNWGAFYLIAF